MRRLSSHATLFFARFLPVFWYVFFGSLCLAVWIIEPDEFAMGTAMMWRVGILIFYLIFGLIIYFTIWKLRRVEFDDDFLYVSNYFKTLRIPFDQILTIHTKPIFNKTICSISLKHKGSFGQKISCLSDELKWTDLMIALKERGFDLQINDSKQN